MEHRMQAISTFVNDEVSGLDDVYDYLLNPMIVYGAILILIMVSTIFFTMLTQVRSECADAQFRIVRMVRGQRQVLFQKRHAEATSSQIENELYEAKTKLGVLEEVCKTMNIDVQEKLAKALAEDRAKYEKEKENYEELDQEISPVAMKNPVA